MRQSCTATRNPATAKEPGFSQRVSADGGFPGESSQGAPPKAFNPRSDRAFLNFISTKSVGNFVPWRSPARAARDFSGSTGGTSDGSGGPLAVTINLTTIGCFRSLASASVDAPF